MTINIDALTGALEQIGAIGQSEKTFRAGDHTVGIRLLGADEEKEVEKHAQIAWSEAVDDTDPAAVADWVDRARIATLSHVIFRIDDLDFRNEEYIETGNLDEAGTPIRKPRYLVMREIIQHWTRSVIHLCYVKYSELQAMVEVSASQAIEVNEDSLNTEIKRLLGRVDTLEKLKSRRDTTDAAKEKVEKAREAIDEYSSKQDEIRNGVPSVDPQVTEAQPEQPTEPAQPAQRRSQIPARAAPPQRREPSPAAQEPVTPAQPEQPPEEPTDAQGIPLPHEGDSFFDTSEPEQAMATELRRQAHLRRQRNTPGPMADPVPDQDDILPGAPKGEPRHREAQNAADATLNLAPEETVRRVPKKSGDDEVEGIRMPVEELSPRNRPAKPPRTAKANAGPEVTMNPRFRGPGQT